MIIGGHSQGGFAIIYVMSKTLSKWAAIPAFLALAGCFSFETVPLGAEASSRLRVDCVQGEAVEHVVVSNYGWYLFNTWPLACGRAGSGMLGFTLFSDQVNERVVLDRFIGYAEKRNCDVTDLNLFNDEEVLMTIGFGGLSIPLPYLVSFRDVQYSGVLVKRNSAEDAKVKRRRLSAEMRSLLESLPDGDAR